MDNSNFMNLMSKFNIKNLEDKLYWVEVDHNEYVVDTETHLLFPEIGDETHVEIRVYGSREDRTISGNHYTPDSIQKISNEVKADILSVEYLGDTVELTELQEKYLGDKINGLIEME